MSIAREIIVPLVAAATGAFGGFVGALFIKEAALEGSGTTWDIERSKKVMELATASHKSEKQGPSFAAWACYYAIVYDCTTQVWNADAGYTIQINPDLCPPPISTGDMNSCGYEPKFILESSAD